VKIISVRIRVRIISVRIISVRIISGCVPQGVTLETGEHLPYLSILVIRDPKADCLSHRRVGQQDPIHLIR
jgi:hypothetical protein